MRAVERDTAEDHHVAGSNANIFRRRNRDAQPHGMARTDGPSALGTWLGRLGWSYLHTSGQGVESNRIESIN